MVYLANAFSIQMLPGNRTVDVRFAPISTTTASQIYHQSPEVVNCIGHLDTAAVVSEMLNTDVGAPRTNISIQEGDELIVAQVVGGRLPEGCKTLPEGVGIRFYLVSIQVAF